MGAPAEQPPFPRDAWPTFELKRMPNGQMGVLMEFPATPEMVKLGIDVIGFNVEPRRVETMHANIADVLDALGLVASPLQRALAHVCISEADVKQMVDRFLSWTLPADFRPDGGVSYEEPPPQFVRPTGTNLFTATQAEAMVRHMLAGLKVQR